MMFDHQRYLVLAAHYDDEALMFGDLLIELARRQKEIWIAILTNAAATNPPKTEEQWAREPVRQACRLGAFARVCMDLKAKAWHWKFPQAYSEEQKGRERPGLVSSFLLHCSRWQCFDVIVSHAPDGDYRDEKYAQGWHVAREQHKFAAELALELGATQGAKVLLRDLRGEIVPPHHDDDKGLTKKKLLEYYRYGCTQTPTWDAEKNYPEFVNEPERYSLVS